MRMHPWGDSQDARKRQVRARPWASSTSLPFHDFSTLHAFLFTPLLHSQPFQSEITNKHIKASSGIKGELKLTNLRSRKHIFTLKHKLGDNHETMLFH